MNYVPINLISRALALVALAVTMQSGMAAPTIIGTSLRYGLTPTLPPHTLATFNFTIENPDARETTVTISLEAEEGGNVFTKTLRIGPKATVDDRCIIMVSPSEKYNATLTWNGDLIASDKCVTRLESGNRNPLVFINDDDDFSGTSDLSKNPAMARPLYLTTLRAANTPQNWSFYTEAMAVVMVKPAFQAMNPLQIQALLDFVRHGGTMLWISPEGILAAADTPFNELLPVVPIRVRRHEDFRFLEKWRSASAAPLQPADWLVPEGLPFLESIAARDGVTSISLDDFPVCRFHRFGLGTVGMIAFDPCSPFSRKAAFYVPLWNHLLAWCTRYPVTGGKGGAEEQARMFGHLSGFPIPRLSAIQMLLGSYLGGIALILLLGFLLRRYIIAWLLVAVTGVFLTICIFNGAYQLAKTQHSQVATSIKLQTWSHDRFQGEKTISLFSKTDVRPNLLSTDRLALFYPLCTPSMLSMYARRDAFAQPLRVHREADRCSIDRLQVQALKPRKFCLSFAENAPKISSYPELHWSPGGVTLKNWLLPDGFPAPEYGFMVLPGGVRPLAVKGRECRDGGASTGLQLDLVAVAAQDYLKNMRIPTPCLALITTLRDTSPERFNVVADKARFFENEYTITLLPVTQVMESARVRLTPECIALTPAETFSRMIFRNGVWTDTTLRSTETYPLVVQIPLAIASNLTLDEITVDADISNPGGNVDLSVLLEDPTQPLLKPSANSITTPTASSPDLSRQPQPKPGADMIKAPPGYAANSRNGTRFSFTGLSKINVLNPQNGRLGVLLVLQQKKKLTDMMDVERVNHWKVTSLQVTVSGTLSENALPMRYGP